ncbi:MAG TPA: pentapeptide repeat-containing protein, partial [Alphaproteobacteria bacterium]|nr:pentapeptide repeat-containing protein [Alphaproteobacteria bacterium]
ADLSNVQLNRAVIDGAALDGANLTDANVFGVDLSRAVYGFLDTSTTITVDDSAETQALVTEMIIAHERWVTSSGTDGQRADFSNADLSGNDFSGHNLRGALFVEARLRSAKFNRTTLDLADFSKADLTGASFGGANLRGTNFTNANLRRTDFRKADLSVETAVLADGSTREWLPRFVECQVDEADFTEAKASRLIAKGVSVHNAIGDKTFLQLLMPTAA